MASFLNPDVRGDIIVPAGVNRMKIQCWAGGGGGGLAGGGGGACVETVITVIPDWEIQATVGYGGNPGQDGTLSKVETPLGIVALANPGKGAVEDTPGAGGALFGCIGNTQRVGGNGSQSHYQASNGITYGGGGGGRPYYNTQNALWMPGADASPSSSTGGWMGGGDGGWWSTASSWGAAGNGMSYGAGGGGKPRSDGQGGAPGSGLHGYVYITFFNE